MELVEDTPVKDGELICISSLEPVTFCYPYESSASGDQLLALARISRTRLGQRHAETLFEHRNFIPKQWTGRHLVFPGTVRLHASGKLFVPCLEEWDVGAGKQWEVKFYLLERKWGLRDQLLSLLPERLAEIALVGAPVQQD